MYRGTTPDITITLDEEINVTDIKEMWVTFKQCDTELTFNQDEVTFGTVTESGHTYTTILVELSQEQTLQFTGDYDVNLQVRYVYDDGESYCTNIVQIPVDYVLKGGVIGGGS